MKRKIQYITSFTALLILLSGCASSRKTGKTITTTPSSYVVAPDSANQVHLDMIFHIPENYLSKRSRLIITPQLVVDDTVREAYLPLVLNALIYDKKINRKKVLDNYVDPYGGKEIKLGKASRSFDLPYMNTIQLPEGIESGLMVVVVSLDGCGECSGIDTIDIASISDPVTLMQDVKESLKLSWVEPEFVIRPKVMEGRGVANLKFNINKSGINFSMGNNRQEMEDMVSTLIPILEDSLATLNSITVTGMASADGPFSFNTSLARNRAASAKRWLVNRLNLGSDIQRYIIINSRPEGWAPVLAFMTADGNPDSVAVKNILDKYTEGNDDVQEYFIRHLSCWDNIKTKYLQKERKVEYVYNYTIKSFSDDADLMEMYKKRPDAFNEEELLRVATLVKSLDDKKEVYKTIMNYFPQSQIAANNLAAIYLLEENADEARKVLYLLDDNSPRLLNTLAASYVYSGNYEKAAELLQYVDLSDARYNLGLLKAKNRKFYEAYELLRPFADLNSAIVALSINKNDDAKAILSTLKEENSVVEYARSLIAARLEEDAVFYKHIKKACEDEKLRKRAATEPDFYSYHADVLFQTLINKR